MQDKEELERQFTGSTTPTHLKDLAEDFSGGDDPVPPPYGVSEESPHKFIIGNEEASIPGGFSATIQIEKLVHYDGLPPLKKATPGSVGIDLYAAHEGTLLLNSIGATVIVPTGIKIALPHGLEAQIRPRSGLAAHEGITVLNSPGTIDSDYRGEIKVILTKLTTGKAKIERGMRIAQMVICPVVLPTLEYVDCVGTTSRGEAGFGSTGNK